MVGTLARAIEIAGKPRARVVCGGLRAITASQYDLGVVSMIEAIRADPVL